jgi:ParB family transcriptional regulator, chromosome partitioning protein
MEAKKNRGLGRGLNALFEDEENTSFQQQPDTAQNSTRGNRTMIGVDQLAPGKFQPRTMFNDETLSELAESIKTHGLLQPILVRPIGLNSGKYEIIAGERRWRASQKAQLHEIPAIIMELADSEVMEIALVENLQREDLNPVDEAMGYKRLMGEYNYTQEELGESLGKSRSHIANMVRILTLPDIVLGWVERGDLSMGHARALITAKEPESLAKEVISKGLSVRETEKLAAEFSGRPPKSGKIAGVTSGKDVDTVALEQELSNKLGLNVVIDSKNGTSGKISIEFKTLDQLDTVIAKISR